jgi:hypothetical protein
MSGKPIPAFDHVLLPRVILGETNQGVWANIQIREVKLGVLLRSSSTVDCTPIDLYL